MIAYFPASEDEGRRIVEREELRAVPDRPGVFRFRTCRGSLSCLNPIHEASGIAGQMIHSARVRDEDPKKRWTDPHRTWRWAVARKLPRTQRRTLATLSDP